MAVEKKPKVYEIGYWIAHEHQGHGYAYEAACALLQYAHKHLPHHQILAKCLKENLASQGLLIKLGFKKTHEQLAYSVPYQAQKKFLFYELQNHKD